MDGVTFGTKHSYRDWGLLLKSRPVISPPSPKTVYVDIPGSDGIIDLTESLTGDVKFDNRTITCEFVVLDARNRWSNIYSEIMDYLHGQRMKVRLDEDMAYYYEGRLQVNEWKSDKVTSTITIEGDVEPYKMEMFSSLEDWEWDSFSFETGVIRDYKNLSVEGSLRIDIPPTRKVVVPIIHVINKNADEAMTVRCGWGETYTLSEGENRILNIKISQKNQYNFLTFTGNGSVSIDYRGGRL